MPLPLPKLDNRTFEQLFAEGRAQLPRLAPDWTDHNYSDPGITLIDLLAYLTEQDFYRLDRVPPASVRAFLRMVGVELRQAVAAETVLLLGQDPPGAAVALPTGLLFGPPGKPLPGLTFQSLHALDLSPASLKAVCAPPQTAAAGSGELQELSTENVIDGRRYLPFGRHPTAGAALHLGFDQPFSPGGAPLRVSLYVFVGEPAVDRETRRRLIAEWQAMKADAAACQPEPYVCQPGKPLAEPPRRRTCIPDWRQHHSVRTMWEYWSAGGKWTPLAEVEDETRALTLSGPVRFAAPADQAAGAQPADLPPGRFFIRCRLVRGQYECPPQIDGVGHNAVLAAHQADIPAEELLGASDGRAGQVFSLPNNYSAGHQPALPGSFQVRLELEGGGVEEWQEAAFWDLVGPHDATFVLDATAGTLTFGDGRQGRLPPAGAQVKASYTTGGGPAGNLPARSLGRALTGAHNSALVPGWGALQPTITVLQPLQALGGAAAERLSQAVARALGDLAAPQRAVTLDDYEVLARQVPGVAVAQARALPDHHPRYPCFPAPGSVTVVVIPDCSITPPPSQPLPGPDFLQAVQRYLERRRTLTDEVHVIGPCYTPVSVSARLVPLSGVEARALISAAQAALDEFFHPLTGGPEGGGWPIGRDVYRSEVLALLAGLPGVEYVAELGLQCSGDNDPQCDNLTICPDCLAASGSHHITVVSPQYSAARSEA